MKTVLLADDDREFVNLLAQQLYSLELRPIVAYDALSAMILLKHDIPDLAILDMDMPYGNGLSLCDMMRSEPTWATIPVVLLTGRTEPALRRRASRLGISMIKKTVGYWEVLESKVCDLLGVESSVPAPLHLRKRSIKI